MINQHELLKQICNTIWYKNKELDFNHSFWIVRKRENEIWFRILDIREIIFTTEFQDKFWNYKEFGFSKRFFQSEVMDSLDNPTQYLADLLWITNKKHDD